MDTVSLEHAYRVIIIIYCWDQQNANFGLFAVSTVPNIRGSFRDLSSFKIVYKRDEVTKTLHYLYDRDHGISRRNTEEIHELRQPMLL